MATKTIEETGYRIVETKDGWDKLVSTNKDSQSGEMTSYMMRKTPSASDCHLNMSMFPTKCTRPEDRDCDLCHESAEHERELSAEAHKRDLAEEKTRLASLPVLSANQVRVWHSLTRLCGCSGISIGTIRGKSIFIKLHEKTYRIDKARLDAGERQFRDSWCFEKFDPEKNASESIQDRNWQD